jgi:hypothetical protein
LPIWTTADLRRERAGMNLQSSSGAVPSQDPSHAIAKFSGSFSATCQELGDLHATFGRIL